MEIKVDMDRLHRLTEELERYGYDVEDLNESNVYDALFLGQQLRRVADELKMIINTGYDAERH